MMARFFFRTQPMREIDFDDDDEQDIAEEREIHKKKRNPGINLCTPDNYEGVNQIAEVIESGDNALINTRKLSVGDRRRVTDFLSGLTYHRGYELLFIGEELIICKVQ